jgi:hypothetical protein
MALALGFTAACLLASAGLAAGAKTRRAGLPEVEREFRQLSPAARQLTGPLFWLHGDESKERLQEYLKAVADGGNGSFTAESRPHTDWLGEGWYRDLGICLDSAKQLGLKMWIFDEKWWPSGEVAGKVPAQYGAKRLVAAAEQVVGPSTFEKAGYSNPRRIALLAGRVTPSGIDGRSLVDLTPRLKGGVLRWSVPKGTWSLMHFSWETVGGRPLVDGASQDSVDWYIKTVYQPHYDRFSADFGKTISGYFYDEPETPGDWGTEVMKVLAERKIDWKKALVSWRFQLAGEEQAAARYQYQDALAEAWGRTLYGGLAKWCKAHGVKSMGHFLEHANAYLAQGLCAGNMLQLQKYSDMGAIDAVFDQFIWGQRVARDAPCWQTPKLGSSVTHAYGKPDDVTMVEIFGARGQDLTYPEMKWWADHMQVSGVNFLIPHSFNPKAPKDTDCPPYFYMGAYEPRFPLYKVFADYTSRLSLMLTGGRHVCPVALLYLGNSAHVGKAVTPEQMSESLQDALYDCDWIPYEVLERDMKVQGANLRLRQESYRVLVVPPVETIPYATLAKVKAFYDAGGVVVGHGFVPSRSATLGRSSRQIASLVKVIWGEPKPGLGVCRVSPGGGRSYLLPQAPTPEDLQRVLGEDAGVRPTLEVVEGRTDHWLHVLHRVKDGRDLFFVTNQNHQGAARRFVFRVKAQGVPECWDAVRQEVTAPQYRRSGEAVELPMTLEPNQSVLLVFSPQKRDLPRRLDAAALRGDPIELTRLPVTVQLPPSLNSGDVASRLEGLSWVWSAEGDPRTAPPGTCRFRSVVTLDSAARVRRAVFVGTADNALELFVNGRSVGKSDEAGEGWRNPVELDCAALLRSGANQLAVLATNGGSGPNPAGLLGRLDVTLEDGSVVSFRVDDTWKASPSSGPGWTEAGFDDSAWPRAKTVARFGESPWGRLASQLTLSPAVADPYLGECDVPAEALAKDNRVYVEAQELAPEEAARVTVNGLDAGGFIGRPLRLDVTSHLKLGRNQVRLEPFAPKSVRLVVVRPEG